MKGLSHNPQKRKKNGGRLILLSYHKETAHLGDKNQQKC